MGVNTILVLAMVVGISTSTGIAPSNEGIEATSKPGKKLYLLGVSVNHARVYASTEVIEAIQRAGGNVGAFLYDESCVTLLTSDTYDPFVAINQQPWSDFRLPAQTVYVELPPQDFQRFHDQLDLTQVGSSIASVFRPPDERSGGSRSSELTSESKCSFNKLCMEKGAQEGEEKLTTELQCGGFTLEVSTEGDFKPGIKTRLGSITFP